MASITKYYGIGGPVPFEDVDVAHDNRRYLDPHLLRLRVAPMAFGAQAVHCLDTYFESISISAMSSSANMRAAALSNLQRFTEPWETRLGMAEKGFSGHGGADDIGARIWEAMTTDVQALLEVGILKHLEELPLFVKGVDRDITSDVTTRIVFGALADFTAHVLTLRPEFTTAPHKTADFVRQVWDPLNYEWATRNVRLPIADGRPLLLVPKGWTRHNLLMSPTRFYETSLLSYIQEERAVVLSDGRVARTPKDRLKRQPGLKRCRETHLETTIRAYRTAQDDLVDMFRAFVRRQFEASGESDAA